MKSRVKITRKMVADLEEEVFENTVEACQDNNVMFLIALNEEFRFGKERLERAMIAYNRVADEYAKFQNQGYSDEDIHEKLCSRLESMGIAPDSIYTGEISFYESRVRMKRIQQNLQPTVKEANEAYRQLQMMKELLHAK